LGSRKHVTGEKQIIIKKKKKKREKRGEFFQFEKMCEYVLLIFYLISFIKSKKERNYNQLDSKEETFLQYKQLIARF
jgi:hypothetical protein